MEKEFSILKYLKYIFRKWIVLLVCFVLGVGAGVALNFINEANAMQVYEGSIIINFNDYVAQKHGTSSEPISDGEYSSYSTSVSTLLNTLEKGDLKNKTYEEVKDSVYPKLSEKERQQEFFENFVVYRDDMTLNVGFVYECKKESDITIAKEAVNQWLNFAIARVKLADEVFNVDGNGPATVVEADREYEISNEKYAPLVGSLEEQSLITSLIIGAIVGVVVGVVIATVLYALDKKIKSVEDLLPDGKNKVLFAGEDALSEKALTNLYATVVDKKITKLLISSVGKNDKTEEFAKAFIAQAKECGSEFALVALSDWKKERFDASVPTVYCYDGGEVSEIGYIAGRVEGTALIADHSAVTAKEFVSAVDAVGEKYLGVNLYNITKTYLD